MTDVLFEFLHGEIVRYYVKQSEKYSETKGSNGEFSVNDESAAKLEQLGTRVGAHLVELCTVDTTRFKEPTDAMKYVCKDFWVTCFRKQIDLLRTDNAGMFEMHDKQFRLFQSISATTQYSPECRALLHFPCGLLRGALTQLGYAPISVVAECTVLPICKFYVTLPQRTVQ